FGGKTSYDADNRPLLVMRSNLWASGYDVDGTDQTSLGQFSGRVQQTYKHSVPRLSRHLARKLSLRRKRSSPNVFEMAATETITSIILIKLIRVSLGTVRHPRRFKIVVIDIQITLKQMLRDFIGIRVNR